MSDDKKTADELVQENKSDNSSEENKFPLEGEELGEGEVVLDDGSTVRGKYYTVRLGKGIGAGGMGVVYKIDDLNIVMVRRNRVLRGEGNPRFWGIEDDVKKVNGKYQLTVEQKRTIIETGDKRWEETSGIGDGKTTKSEDGKPKRADTRRLEQSVLEYHDKDMLGKTFVAKFISEDRRTDDNSMRRFRREFTIVRDELRHDNIVRGIDYYVDDGDVAFMILEEVPDARPLGKVSAPRDTILDLLGQSLDGLVHAHEKGIVHRDIKPDNLLVSTRRGDGKKTYELKIADFGLGKITEKAGSSSTDNVTKLTKEHAVFGTEDYMSPEQMLGEVVDGRTDVYSLGISFYQRFTGDLPFVGLDAYLKIRKRKDATFITRKNERSTTILPEIEDLIAGMMDPHREDRYTSKQAFFELNKMRNRDSDETKKKSTKEIRRSIGQYDITETLDSDASMELGKLYAELAEASPRYDAVPRNIEKTGARIVKLEEKIDKLGTEDEEAKENVEKDKLSAELELAIRNHVKQTKNRQHFFEQAAEWYSKAQGEEARFLSDLYRKKAIVEKRRLKQLSKKEKKPMAGWKKWLIGGAATVALAAAVAAKPVYDYVSNKNQSAAALELLVESEGLYKTGSLVEAGSKAEEALKLWDALSDKWRPKDYDALKTIPDLAKKEGKIKQYLSTLSSLIKDHEFGEFETIINDLESLLTELKSAAPVRELAQIITRRADTYSTQLEGYKDRAKLEHVKINQAKYDGLVKDKKFTEADKVFEDNEKRLNELKQSSVQEQLSPYEKKHKEQKTGKEDREDDIDDLTRVLEKLADFQNEIKEKSDGLSSDDPKFFPKGDLEKLSDRINRYSFRLGDVDEENVDPDSYKRASKGYEKIDTDIENLGKRLATTQTTAVEKRFQAIDAIITYLEKNFAVDDGMNRIEEIANHFPDIKEMLENIDGDITGSLENITDKEDLEKRLAEALTQYASVREQIESASVLRGKADAGDLDSMVGFGELCFNKLDYTRAEKYFKDAKKEAEKSKNAQAVQGIDAYLAVMSLKDSIGQHDIAWLTDQKRKADAGDLDSMISLGESFFNGQNYSWAERYFNDAKKKAEESKDEKRIQDATIYLRIVKADQEVSANQILVRNGITSNYVSGYQEIIESLKEDDSGKTAGNTIIEIYQMLDRMGEISELSDAVNETKEKTKPFRDLVSKITDSQANYDANRDDEEAKKEYEGYLKQFSEMISNGEGVEYRSFARVVKIVTGYLERGANKESEADRVLEIATDAEKVGMNDYALRLLKRIQDSTQLDKESRELVVEDIQRLGN